MPNWCDNILRLEHSDKSKLEEALQALKDEKLLDWFVPMPDHIKLGDVSGYEMLSEDNWYGWRSQELGHKIGHCQSRVISGYRTIALNFLLTRHGTPQFPLMMLLLPSMALNLWHSSTNSIRILVANTYQTKRNFTSLVTKFRPILMRCLASRNGNGNRNRRHTNRRNGELENPRLETTINSGGLVIPFLPIFPSFYNH